MLHRRRIAETFPLLGKPRRTWRSGEATIGAPSTPLSPYRVVTGTVEALFSRFDDARK
jgi:hypothetical protein